MLRYLVAGTFVLLAWVIIASLGLSLSWALALTALVGLVLLSMFLVERLKERRAARALENAFAAQAAQDASAARPDLAEDIARVGNELKRAIDALNKSKGGKAALYRLPWYVIVGPPGCGKSTALRSSGLDFPFKSSTGHAAVRGVGGTRDCDFWMTSDAVLLDTAGRWTTEDQDRDEWLGFLDLLKTHRPRLPLNGVIAAVSVTDVAAASEDARMALAERMRGRIDEMQEHLAMSLPVYVLFTKCDLVPGFVETFGHMPRKERGGIWGFTVPLSKRDGRSSGERFSAHFSEMLAALNQRTAKRMSEERSLADRELVYAFPQQLEALGPSFQEFVERAMIENIYKETPRLRGVYFTSGTQEGRAIDRVMSKMAEAFGQAPAAMPAPVADTKSYFLRDVFTDVIFRDAAVASRNPREIARQRRKIWLSAASLMFFALLVSTLPTYAFANNRSFLAETETLVREARPTLLGQSDRPIDPDELAPLRDRLDELETHREDSPPWEYGFGMYQSDVVRPLLDVYTSAVGRRIVEPMLRAAERDLAAWTERAASESRPDAAVVHAQYAQLKLYLFLTGPADDDQSALDEANRADVADQLTAAWATGLGIERHDSRQAAMRSDIERYLDAFTDGALQPSPRNGTIVVGARERLRALADTRLAVDTIKNTVEPHHLQLSLARLLGRESLAIIGTHTVPGAFTYVGWTRHVQAMLEGDVLSVLEDDWVVGVQPEGTPHQQSIARAERADRIREAYFERYIQEWRDFIAEVSVTSIESSAEQFAVLDDFLAGDPQTWTLLLRRIERNVTLMEAQTADGGIALPTRPLTRVFDNALGRRTPASAQEVGDIREILQGEVTSDETPEEIQGEWLVRQAFAGLIALVPHASDHAREGTAPVAIYEEQVEYLHIAIERDYDIDEPRAEAITQTSRVIDNADTAWQARLRTWWLPPLAAPTTAAPTTAAP